MLHGLLIHSHTSLIGVINVSHPRLLKFLLLHPSSGFVLRCLLSSRDFFTALIMLSLELVVTSVRMGHHITVNSLIMFKKDLKC